MEQSRPARARARAVRLVIGLLCVLGAVRILVFAAAYPFFNYIDESLHVDTILDFAREGLPGPGDDRFHIDDARLLSRYGMGHTAPPYAAAHDRLPPDERARAIEAEAQRTIKYRNAETFAPPLYYALAAGWYRLGQLIGLRDTMLLYWLRFLSAPLYAAAIWIGCKICLDCHPKRPQLAVGVGIFMAAWPQDILYTINSDVMSPFAVALALYLLVRWVQSPRPSMKLAACAGAAASMAMLTKYTNVAAIFVIPIAILFAWGRRRDAGQRATAEIATLLLAAAIPLGAWFIRCQLAFGDWTASRDKAAMLDWTVLTLEQSLRHPIFTVPGFFEFITRLCVTFWRGELVWNNSIQRVPWVDTAFLVVSAVGLLGVLGWLLRPSPAGRQERPLAMIYLVAVAGSVVFLGLISTRYDYGHCFFPSRGFPYFGAGRLLTGVMVPFAILLIGGMEELVPPRGRFRSGVALAAALAVLCVASDIWLTTTASGTNTRSVFQSPSNFYRLISGSSAGRDAGADAGWPGGKSSSNSMTRMSPNHL